MKSTLRTPPRCNIHAKKKVFIHTLINSESLSGCLEDILISRAGRDTEWSYFSPLTQLHTTKDLDSALIQQPPKLQQILKFVLVSRHLFFYSADTLPNAAGGGKKKKKLEGNGIFGSHNMNTALSQHLLTPSINGLMISAGIPSAPTVRPQIWDPSRHGATI